jgi:hypothetical protein
MPEKQLNHFIPRFMLNFWAKKNEQELFGVDVYDIGRAKYLFSDGTGKKAYSFAIEKNGYIPVIEEKRQTNLEDWFSGLEGTLSLAIREFSENEITLFSDPQEYSKFLLAVLSFKYRTQAFVGHVTHYLTDNSDIKVFHDPSKPAKLIALENIINATRDDLAEYGNCDIEIYHSQGAAFIIGDSPYVTDAIDNWDLLILSNKLMLMIRKNNLSSPRFKFLPIEKERVYLVNQLIAGKAHFWIVGETKEQLEQYQEYADQKTALNISYLPQKNLTQGYYF